MFSDFFSIFEGLCVGGILFFSFFAVTRKRLQPLALCFAFSSFCLCGLITLTAITSGNVEEYIGVGATLILKVFFVPLLLLHTAKKCNESFQSKISTRTLMSYGLAILSLLGAFFISRKIPIFFDNELVKNSSLFSGLIFVSLSLLFLGLLSLIIRRDIYSQIIGFLTIENGISLFAITALGGTPFLMELGIFTVIALGVILMALLSQQVHDMYKTHDTEKLKELID